ncbi:MAG: hypothetical protein FWD55_06770 [Propionibacteriaceae bacterium]|nr:hypothetical protein [Propionibacteriaceae bacterium]
MVDELRLWAINVDVFRQCFAAPPELATRLWEITDTVAPPRPEPTGLLSKLGPLLRRPPTAPVIIPGVPNHLDAESMMSSRYIASDRLSACWILAKAWLDDLATVKTVIPLPGDKIDELEFDLVRVEIPTQVSIRHLWHRSIDIPLRADDDMSIGYMDSFTVERLTEEWTKAADELEEETAEFSKPLLEFVSAFPQYAEEAGQPVDLIAWWTSR